MAVTLEYGACHFALDFAIKRNVPVAKRKRGTIAAQLQVVGNNHFAAGHQAAQLLVNSVGVCWVLCGKRPREGERKAKLHKQRRADSKRQKKAPSRKNFVTPVCRMKAVQSRKKPLLD
jgi:hypothetical protein